MAALTVEQLDQVLRAFMDRGLLRGDHASGRNGTKLDEKHFRRMDKFDGDPLKFRGWYFDLKVILGGLDEKLAVDLDNCVRLNLSESQIEPGDFKEKHIPAEIHEKYASELYGIICTLTTGEAKLIVKGVMDKGLGQDGNCSHVFAAQKV